MTSSPTSVWVSECQLEKTSCLCGGADTLLNTSLSLCSEKQMLKSIQTAHLDAALASKPALFGMSFLLGIRRDQWSSLCLWSWWWEGGKYVLVRSVQGQNLSVRLHRTSKPLETERRGRGGGGTSCTSSMDCRERDGTAGQRCGGGISVCLWERGSVCLCVCVRARLRTFGLCVISLAELTVRVWLKIWGNEQREGEEQNLDINTAEKTKRQMGNDRAQGKRRKGVIRHSLNTIVHKR